MTNPMSVTDALSFSDIYASEDKRAQEALEVLAAEVRRLTNKCAALVLVAYGTPENPKTPSVEPKAPHELSTVELLNERDRIQGEIARRVLGDPRKSITIGPAGE